MLEYLKYSDKKIHDNLFISEPIVDKSLNSPNQVLVRIPDSKKPITDVILSFDGQNLFDKKTSHFGSIFNLEKLIQTAETDRDKNILVIAVTSNNQRQTQYNPYPRKASKISSSHLKMIILDVDENVIRSRKEDTLFDDNLKSINFYSIYGAIFVFIFSLYPYVYLLMRQALMTQSGSYIEIAKISGLNIRQILYKVSLPISRPALAGGVTLVIMETLADYGVSDYLGIDTFTKGIYRAWFNLGDIASAGKLSAILLITVGIVIALERNLRGNEAWWKASRRFVKKIIS